MNFVITMAGSGKRFADAGYKGPKYALEAHGRTLFWWSIVSLRDHFAGARFVFVARAEDRAGPFIAAECEALGVERHELVELPGLTAGQAETARLGMGGIGDGEPVAIFNIDTHVSPGAVRLPGRDSRAAGHVPCFRADGAHWSFVRPGPGETATELREKVRISDLATIGLYWFAGREWFLRALARQQAPGTPRDGGELYVAPLYNFVIAEGGEVTYSVVPAQAVRVLGTPAELEAFRKSAIELPRAPSAAP